MSATGKTGAKKNISHSPAGIGRTTLSKRTSLIPSLLVRLSTTIDVWIERSRQRYALGELAGNDHLLADIGLSLEQAHREARKPFWVFSKEVGIDVHHIAQSRTASTRSSRAPGLLIRPPRAGAENRTTRVPPNPDNTTQRRTILPLDTAAVVVCAAYKGFFAIAS